MAPWNIKSRFLGSPASRNFFVFIGGADHELEALCGLHFQKRWHSLFDVHFVIV